MTTSSDGGARVAVRIENLMELYEAEAGKLSAEQIHRVEVSDALVDCDYAFLCMPSRLISQLGLGDPVTAARPHTLR